MNLFEEQPTKSRSILPPTESASSHNVMESSDTNGNPNSGGQATLSNVKKNGTSATTFHQRDPQRISFEGKVPIYG